MASSDETKTELHARIIKITYTGGKVDRNDVMVSEVDYGALFEVWAAILGWN